MDVDNLGAQNQLLQFLMGLNATFDLSRNQILMMDMLPTVTKVYSMILRVEKQMQVNMLLSDVFNVSVFEVLKESGKGKAFAGAVDDKSNSSLEKSDVADFLKSELRKLMKEEDVSLDPLQINFVHMEDFVGKVSCPSSIKSTSWIIDTGATKHICSDIKRFVSYSEPVYQAFINLSDGSKQLIKYIGTVKLSENLILSHVLHIPNFSVNLILSMAYEAWISFNASCKTYSFYQLKYDKCYF
ncbi:UNVERIFIED_CONTAM: hypothetical protein Sradi_2064900 [Sesamum radiatum]|uniref:Retrovirus-related Pol polyprotein from transposon TNT 1-94-like beta-barrel domain-containing protein n=1 Tax=Sesamum radiatum TaxID=300843 RepID=A0AAW2THL9_SESRA